MLMDDGRVLDGTGNVADTGTFVARLAVIISSVNTRVTIRDAKLTSIVGPFSSLLGRCVPAFGRATPSAVESIKTRTFAQPVCVLVHHER